MTNNAKLWQLDLREPSGQAKEPTLVERVERLELLVRRLLKTTNRNTRDIRPWPDEDDHSE